MRSNIEAFVENEQLILYCNASGNPPPEYKWYKVEYSKMNLTINFSFYLSAGEYQIHSKFVR